MIIVAPPCFTSPINPSPSSPPPTRTQPNLNTAPRHTHTLSLPPSPMEKSISPTATMAKKLYYVLRVIYYMIRKEISKKRNLLIDLHLHLKRGKIAGKALSNLITTFHHHHHHHRHGGKGNTISSSSSSSSSSFSCRHVDPDLSFYNPRREVEFSCSTTPSYPSFLLSNKHGGKNRRKNNYYYYPSPAAVAEVFESLNDIASNYDGITDTQYSVGPSPLVVGPSPRLVRQLRITDSPFPAKEDEAGDGGKVDKEAEEFIKWFYQQLRVQQADTTPTPEHKLQRRRQRM